MSASDVIHEPGLPMQHKMLLPAGQLLLSASSNRCSVRLLTHSLISEPLHVLPLTLLAQCTFLSACNDRGMSNA